MDGMREIASSYYDRASEAEKESIKQSFAKLDINGDGRISVAELKKTVSSWLCEEAVLKKLDKNGDGCLDFEEFLCLHYMEKKVAIGKCGGCWDLLVGPYFSCLLCLGRGADTYDLCCACYRRDAVPSHEHSVEHMMDHHSLLMHFRNRLADDEKAQNKREEGIPRSYYDRASEAQKKSTGHYDRASEAQKKSTGHYDRASEAQKKSIRQFFTKLDINSDGREYKKKESVVEAVSDEKALQKRGMQELREIAKAHYHAGSTQVKGLALDFFKSMDSDGDNRVNMSEFLAFMRQEGYSYMQNACFFTEIDVDGNGTLDFFEVMTLYYIIKSGRPFCDGCAKFIPGLFFSCVECFNNPKNSFNLCSDCYQSANCKHNHDGRSLFLDNYALLQAKRDPELARATGVNSNETGNSPTTDIVLSDSKLKLSKHKAAFYVLEKAVRTATITGSLCSIL